MIIIRGSGMGGDGMKKMFKGKKGVSPVIGVILMVAITVILAAVIASFVFGMGSKVKSAPQASFMLEDNSTALGNDPTGNMSLFDAMLYGGGPLTCSELQITIKDLATGRTWTLNWNSTENALRFEAKENNIVVLWATTGQKKALSPGDTMVFWENATALGNNKIKAGHALEMRVLHIPTGTIIYDGQVVVY